MRTENSSRNKLIQENQKELQNLKQKQDLALEKIKLTQEKNLNQAKLDGRIKLENLRSQNDLKVVDQLKKNEAVLENLKESLNLTRDTTNKELKNIQEAHLNRVENDKTRYQADYQDRANAHNEKMQDISHESSIELEKLQRDIKRERHEVISDGRFEKSQAEETGKEKIELTKNEFARRHQNKQDQYYRALSQQDKSYKDRLSSLENKYQHRLETRTEQTTKNLENLEKIENGKQSTQINKFETRYKTTFEQQEKLLQELLSKKESLMADFNKDLFTSYEVNAKKAQDEFYTFGKIESALSEIENGYELRVPIAKEEASKVQMVAEGRELKLTMTRNFEQESVNEKGENFIKKTEAYISRIPVEDFVDAKTIKSQYSDGNLIFTIKKA